MAMASWLGEIGYVEASSGRQQEHGPRNNNNGSYFAGVYGSTAPRGDMAHNKLRIPHIGSDPRPSPRGGYIHDHELWNAKFQELCEYRRTKGDCIVPQKYAANPNLGSWVLKQRQQYKLSLRGSKTQITQERIRKLQGIGFVWDTDEARWEAQFTTLVTYKEKRGDCDVRCGKNGLGNWVREQRRQYKLHKEGSPSPLTLTRIERMEALGFLWISPRSPKQATSFYPPYPVADWQTRFEQLCEFRQKHGDCLVPQKYPKNPELGRWVQKQRYNYKLSLKGEASSLSKGRVCALESIGFVWVVRRVEWETQFENLVCYKKAHGHCNVPYSGSGLGSWVITQRLHYMQYAVGHNSLISQSRIERLESLGFQWREGVAAERQDFDVNKGQEVTWAPRENAPTDEIRRTVKVGVAGPSWQMMSAPSQRDSTRPSSLVENTKHKVETAHPESANAHPHQSSEETSGTKRSADSAGVSVVSEEDKLNPKAAKRSCGVEAATPVKANVGIHSSRATKQDTSDNMKLAKATLIQSLQAYRLYIETYARVPQLYKHAIDISVLIGHLVGGTTSVKGIAPGPIRSIKDHTHTPVRNDVHVTKKDLITSLKAYTILTMKSSDPLTRAHGIDATELIGQLEEGSF